MSSTKTSSTGGPSTTVPEDHPQTRIRLEGPYLNKPRPPPPGSFKPNVSKDKQEDMEGSDTEGSLADFFQPGANLNELLEREIRNLSRRKRHKKDIKADMSWSDEIAKDNSILHNGNVYLYDDCYNEKGSEDKSTYAVQILAGLFLLVFVILTLQLLYYVPVFTPSGGVRTIYVVFAFTYLLPSIIIYVLYIRQEREKKSARERIANAPSVTNMGSKQRDVYMEQQREQRVQEEQQRHQQQLQEHERRLREYERYLQEQQRRLEEQLRQQKQQEQQNKED